MSRRLHRDVMRHLVDDIVSGARVEGELLPKEVDLAAAFDVSRGVARETIRALEERGLISVRHGVGATVNRSDQWDIFDPMLLEALLQTHHDTKILGEYLECRRILEIEAVGMAARRATASDVEMIAAALARMDAATREPSSKEAERAFHEADVRFHQSIVRAAGNRALGVLVERIHSALLLARFPLARPQYRKERAIPEHRRIYEAIAAHDPDEAQRAMRAHLDTVAAYLGEREGDRDDDRHRD